MESSDVAVYAHLRYRFGHEWYRTTGAMSHGSSGNAFAIAAFSSFLKLFCCLDEASSLSDRGVSSRAIVVCGDM